MPNIQWKKNYKIKNTLTKQVFWHPIWVSCALSIFYAKFIKVGAKYPILNKFRCLRQILDPEFVNDREKFAPASGIKPRTSSSMHWIIYHWAMPRLNPHHQIESFSFVFPKIVEIKTGRLQWVKVLSILKRNFLFFLVIKRRHYNV